MFFETNRIFIPFLILWSSSYPIVFSKIKTDHLS